MEDSELPYGGDLNKAMRAQDRPAIRVLMEHRERSKGPEPEPGLAGAAEPAPAPGSSSGIEPEPEPEPEPAQPALPLATAPASGAPTVTVRVKFGKELHELAIDLGAGVGPIQQRLAELTRVPPVSQTLLAPGGRKWSARDDLSLLGVKDGMKLTLIGKVPASWRALASAEKAVEPMAAAVEQISAAAAADTEGLGLEEQMTKLLLKLDGVAVGEDTALRAARKAQVNRVQGLLDALEAKRG